MESILKVEKVKIDKSYFLDTKEEKKNRDDKEYLT